MKPKYKKGNIVRIKPAEYFENHPDYNKKYKFVSKGSRFNMIFMKKYCKREYEINNVTPVQLQFIYTLKSHHSGKLIAYSFDEWMFDDMVKEKLKML